MCVKFMFCDEFFSDSRGQQFYYSKYLGINPVYMNIYDKNHKQLIVQIFSIYPVELLQPLLELTLLILII